MSRAGSPVRSTKSRATSRFRHPAGADLDEDADDAPDHLPEEVRGGDPHENEAVGFGRRRHLDALDDDDRRVVPLRVLAVALEVVPPREEPGGALHGADVERVPHPVDEGLPEAGAPAGDAVAVDALHGVVAGVERGRGDGEGEDVHVGREEVVPALHRIRRVARRGRAAAGGWKRPARTRGRPRRSGRRRGPSRPRPRARGRRPGASPERCAR